MKDTKNIHQPKIREKNLRREQYLVMIDFLKNKKINLSGKKVLDFGSGNGEFAEFLINKEGANVDCYEPSNYSIKILKKRGLKNVKELRENFYDAIFLLDVIEHFIEPEKELDKILKSLVPNGFIFVTTPDHLYWKIRIKCLLGNIEAFEYPNKHFSFFTIFSLKKLMRSKFVEICIGKKMSKLVYFGKKK